jgi:hypothetical protein
MSFAFDARWMGAAALQFRFVAAAARNATSGSTTFVSMGWRLLI